MALLLYFLSEGLEGSKLELNYLKIKTDGGYMYGGDQSLFGKLSSHSGCGMIALCDTILFLRHGEGYSPDLSEYKAFAEDIRDNEVYRHRLNLTGVPAGLIIRILKKHTEKDFRFFSGSSFSQESLHQFIRSSIARGIPLIVRIGANSNSLPYKIVYPLSGQKISEGKMSWHYITVTGITDSGSVIFSSWGGRGEMKCSDLHRYSGLTGGVIAMI